MLTDKICIVTGGGSGIGRAIAIEMATQQAGGVVIADVDADGAAETVRLVERAGADAVFVRTDLREAKQIADLMDATVDRFGGIDVLNNNAGVIETAFMDQPTIVDMPEEIWDLVYEVNLRAVWLGIKFAAPHLRRSQRGPNIINAGSTSGFVGSPLGAAYCSTKGAVHQLTKVAAIELAPTIRCNAYCPGSTVTAMSKGRIASAPDPELVKRWMSGSHLVRRSGQPEEIAQLACFLASDDASFMTGGTYLADGGSLAWRGSNA
ncbi:MAG: glucose 1-dehydrogenase [Pseudonocardiales bacterium]|nr:glucose 1-dehydrogenase [Pseudonocardiales bacterium]